MKSNNSTVRHIPFMLVIVFLSCILVTTCFVVLWSGKGDSPNLYVTTQVSREFIESIHNGDIEIAYSMLSEKFSPAVTQDQFIALIQQDENIFKTYQTIEICDWGVFISDGRVISASGLLYFEGGATVVQISLHKDSDSIWRVQGFKFRSDIDPLPFGLCE